MRLWCGCGDGSGCHHPPLRFIAFSTHCSLTVPFCWFPLFIPSPSHSRTQVLAVGYGVHTSGVSLFIAANVCTDVVWRALSPLRVYTSAKGRGVVSECYGVLPALVQALCTVVTQPKRGQSRRCIDTHTHIHTYTHTHRHTDTQAHRH